MSRAAPTFRQTDVVRAIRAARAAGESYFRVEITKDGNLNVIVGEAAPSISAPDPNLSIDVDRWLQEHNAHQPQKS